MADSVTQVVSYGKPKNICPRIYANSHESREEKLNIRVNSRRFAGRKRIYLIAINLDF